MEKEQNALIFMFLLVIIISGVFIAIKKGTIKLDFLQKDEEKEQEPEEPKRDYSKYVATYIDHQLGNVELTIIKIDEDSIEFNLSVEEDEKTYTLKETKLTKILDDSYYFDYKDNYENPGEGRITLTDDNVFLTLDTDIPDTNEEGLSIGNYGSLKLYISSEETNTYEEFLGTYKIQLNEPTKVITIEITEMDKKTLKLTFTYEETAEDGTVTTYPYRIQFVKAIDEEYSFKYTNEMQTNKGDGILKIVDGKLYLTIMDDYSVERLFSNFSNKELTKDKEETSKPTEEQKPEEEKTEEEQ